MPIDEVMGLMLGVPGAQGAGAAWTPAKLSNVVCWLQRDTGLYQDVAATTPCASDGDPVALWQDQSGNAKHFTQGTAGNRPTFRVNSFGGSAGVRFVTDDYLTGGTGWNFTSLFIAVLTKPNVDITSIEPRYGIIAIGSGIDDRHFLTFGGFINAFNRLVAYSDVGGDAEESAYKSDIASGTKLVVFDTFTTSGTQVYINNVAQTVAQETTSPPLSASAEARLGLRYGASFSDYLNGDIAELVICSSVPSTAELASLYAYFSENT